MLKYVVKLQNVYTDLRLPHLQTAAVLIPKL